MPGDAGNMQVPCQCPPRRAKSWDQIRLRDHSVPACQYMSGCVEEFCLEETKPHPPTATSNYQYLSKQSSSWTEAHDTPDKIRSNCYQLFIHIRILENGNLVGKSPNLSGPVFKAWLHHHEVSVKFIYFSVLLLPPQQKEAS